VLDVVSHEVMRIDREDDVVLVRRRVRALAQARGFDTFACAAVTTATSELTRNAWVHGGGGEAVIEEIVEAERVGIRVVDRVLAGGYSTAKSMGLGVSGSRRLVDEFKLESTVGGGTVVTFVKWKPY
jgi:serine/threonine-protein kinase RsbT